MAIRNAPEGRATISFSKLQHSLDALTSTQAWDVSGKEGATLGPRVKQPLRGLMANSLPLTAGERKSETQGRAGGKAAHSDRVQRDPDPANSSHPRLAQPSGAAPGAGAAPFHCRYNTLILGGTGGTKGRTWLLPVMEVPRSKFDESSRRRLIGLGARHLNPILSAAAPPSPVCQRGSRRRSVAGSPGRGTRESRRPEAEGTGSATGSFSFVSSPTLRGRGAAAAVTGSGQPTAEDTCTRDLSTRPPGLAPYPRSRK